MTSEMAPTSRSGDLDETVPVFFLPPRTRAGDPIAGTGQLLLRAARSGGPGARPDLRRVPLGL
jgi:hypothetical protein